MTRPGIGPGRSHFSGVGHGSSQLPDAAQNSANALNSYVQNAAAAAAKGGQGTSINIGDNLTLSGPSVATLAQTLVGGLGSTFRMPENTQSITRIATVKGNFPMIVIAGLSGEGR